MENSPLDVLVVGEALVDFVPLHRGRLRESKGFELHSGGAPCNVAVGLARLGGHPGLISVVGADEFGEFVLRSLDRAGVDRSGVRITDAQQTGLCFITLDAEGDRSFLHRGGDAALELQVEDIRPDRVAAAAAVFFTCGALRTERGVAAIDALTDHATGLVCCDPGVCPAHWGDPQVMGDRLRHAIGRCDVVKCSRPEALNVTGFSDPERAVRALVEGGAQLAVVTLGAEGAVWARRGEQGHVSAPPAVVVDTTGAGDGFMSGLLRRLSQLSEPPRSIPREQLLDHLRFAAGVGTLVVQHRGAVMGIPDLRAG